MKKRRKRPVPRRELTAAQILDWADEFRARIGRWPKRTDGPVVGSHGMTWSRLDSALHSGSLGLPGGSSLVRLLQEQRGYRNMAQLPKLTVAEILAWADAFHDRTQSWPNADSGPIPDSGGESWQRVDAALRNCLRGLRKLTSLAQLLARHRQVRNNKGRPRLSEEQILRWLDAHRDRAGRWPTHEAGPIVDAPGETWNGVDSALRAGVRGLPGGSSIARLLARKRQVRNSRDLPLLPASQILAWADAHHERTGKWPQVRSGPILEAGDGETWSAIEAVLRVGSRGLPGGSTLSRFLRQHRPRQS